MTKATSKSVFQRRTIRGENIILKRFQHLATVPHKGELGTFYITVLDIPKTHNLTQIVSYTDECAIINDLLKINITATILSTTIPVCNITI